MTDDTEHALAAKRILRELLALNKDKPFMPQDAWKIPGLFDWWKEERLKYPA